MAQLEGANKSLENLFGTLFQLYGTSCRLGHTLHISFMYQDESNPLEESEGIGDT